MSRAAFQKSLIKAMDDIGYEHYPDVEGVRFIKYLHNGFYNLMYIQFHRYHANSFTGEFFLSLYPSELYYQAGIGNIYRSRIGMHMKAFERVKYLNNEKQRFDIDGGDAWWYINDENVVENFVYSVICAEPRFLSQSGIYQQVLNNKKLRYYYNTKIVPIIKIASQQDLDKREYTIIPKTDPYKIGFKWFKAAEIFMKEYTTSYQLKSRWVKYLAYEAYMTDKCEKLYGAYNPLLLELELDHEEK